MFNLYDEIFSSFSWDHEKGKKILVKNIFFSNFFLSKYTHYIPLIGASNILNILHVSLCLPRFFLLGHSSWMCGPWRMKRNSVLCLRSTRRATSSSKRATSVRPETNTTMVSPALKTYRSRLGDSHAFCALITMDTLLSYISFLEYVFKWN